MDWKTTASRYAEAPEGLLSLDPQLICYTSISEEQRQEFGRLVATTIDQIEAAQFPPHSGIRFPQNGCVSCSHLGLCLNSRELIDADLIRTPGANNLAWLEELVD
jgi:hypothetical protein